MSINMSAERGWIVFSTVRGNFVSRKKMTQDEARYYMDNSKIVLPYKEVFGYYGDYHFISGYSFHPNSTREEVVKMAKTSNRDQMNWFSFLTKEEEQWRTR